MPYRKLDYAKQYEKYHWIELDLIKRKSDFRPESYKPADYEDIEIKGKIGTDGDAWHERRDICLKKVYHSLDELIGEAKNPKVCTSLATFKPTEILDFTWEDDGREWDAEKLKEVEAQSRQGKLFEQETPHLFKVVKKLPCKFKYRFRDVEGKESNLMIEDWEVGALYWKLIDTGESEEGACKKIRQKFFDDLALTKDLHFFLGTSLQWHSVGKNPFMIVGVFYPKAITQGRLF